MGAEIGATAVPQAIWTGSISFGLVTVPVRLVSATKSQDVRFNQPGDDCVGSRGVDGLPEGIPPNHLPGHLV